MPDQPDELAAQGVGMADHLLSITILVPVLYQIIGPDTFGFRKFIFNNTLF